MGRRIRSSGVTEVQQLQNATIKIVVVKKFIPGIFLGIELISKADSCGILK
jgi:hypothetical protein